MSIQFCDPVACVAAGCTATVCTGKGVPSNHTLYTRSAGVIPGGVNSSIRAFKAVGGTPYVVSRAEGAFVYDVEGNELIDLVQSYGAIILGHAHPKVTEAIRSAAGDGTSYGAPTPREMKLAEAISERVESLTAQLEKAATPFEMEKLQERLGRLSGGVAIISVGGNSDLEIKEKRDRVEDALYATKAAIAEGVIPGGGWPLYNIAAELEGSTLGEDIIKASISSPFLKILSNAGLDLNDDIIEKLIKSPNNTYNAKTGVIVDAYESGLLDPVKVTRVALENALSVASTILTSESVVFDEKREESPEMNMNF